MTNITIEQIRKLNANRTQGGWIYRPDYYEITTDPCIARPCKDVIAKTSCDNGRQSGNSNFIAAAPAVYQLAIKQHAEIEQLKDASAEALTAISYQEELIEILEPAAKRSVVEVRELRKLLDECVEALEEHHSRLNISRDDDIGSLEFIDVAEGYADSPLCEKTMETLNRIKGEK